MEECKYCEAELEENSTVCPKCGKDNAEVNQEVTTEAAPEAAPAKEKLSAGKSILAVAAVVAVMVLLAAVVFNGRVKAEDDDVTDVMIEAVEVDGAKDAVIEAVEVTEEVTETVPPTVPADGNPDDVTCKGTYTADDEAVKAARDVVIATAGEHELTLGQLQVYYWLSVRNFLTQYGAYAAYFGLDYQQPLDTQMCNLMETPMTWQQFFLDDALINWSNYAPVSAAADAAGFELPQEQKDAVANAGEDLAAAAQANGFASVDDLIHTTLGGAVTLEDYQYYMELYFKANGYYNQIAQAIHPSDEEMDAYFAEHEDEYDQSEISKESMYVNVRHILIYPEGADGTNIFVDEFSDEAWAAGEKTAQEILDSWKAGDMTEESFAALANEKSQDPGSNQKGGLYENVVLGEMVEAFNDWCFDPDRQVGDTGIVKTEYGYHVMYFVGSRPIWKETVENDIINETASRMAAEIAEKSPLAVKYSEILLGGADLEA